MKERIHEQTLMDMYREERTAQDIEKYRRFRNEMNWQNQKDKEENMESDLVIHVFLDGDKWCALIGIDLQEGLAGFGDTPVDAIRQLCNEIEIHGWNLGNITLW